MEYFTEEHELFRQSLQTFLEKEAHPHIDEWEENQHIPRDIWKKKLGASIRVVSRLLNKLSNICLALLQEKKISCIGITEPSAGSDAANIQNQSHSRRRPLYCKWF